MTIPRGVHGLLLLVLFAATPAHTVAFLRHSLRGSQQTHWQKRAIRQEHNDPQTLQLKLQLYCRSTPAMSAASLATEAATATRLATGAGAATSNGARAGNAGWGARGRSCAVQRKPLSTVLAAKKVHDGDGDGGADSRGPSPPSTSQPQSSLRSPPAADAALTAREMKAALAALGVSTVGRRHSLVVSECL